MKRLALLLVINSSFTVNAMSDQARAQLAVLERDIDILRGSLPVASAAPAKKQPNPKELMDGFRAEVDKANREFNVSELEAIKQRLQQIDRGSLEQRVDGVIKFDEVYRYDSCLITIRDGIKDIEINQALVAGDPIRLRLLQIKYPYEHYLHASDELGIALSEKIKSLSNNNLAFQLTTRALPIRDVVEQAAKAEQEGNVALLEEMLSKADELKWHFNNEKIKYKALLFASLNRVKAAQEREAAEKKKKAEEQVPRGLADKARALDEEVRREDSIMREYRRPTGWGAWFGRNAMNIVAATTTVLAIIFTWKRYAAAPAR